MQREEGYVHTPWGLMPEPQYVVRVVDADFYQRGFAEGCRDTARRLKGVVETILEDNQDA